MKIINNTRQPKPVAFGGLKPGNVFSSYGAVFQKRPEFVADDNSANTVNLGDGRTHTWFEDSDPVTPLPDATLYLHGAPEPEIPAEVQAVLDALRKHREKYRMSWSEYSANDEWNAVVVAFNAYEATLTPESK